MLRYYPISRVHKNKSAQAGQFQLNGKEYLGSYYETFDGDCYTGKDPITGANELLKPISSLQITSNQTNFDQNSFVPNSVRKQIAIQANLKSVNDSEPVPYYPKPLSTDYKKGYIIRYFTKKINSKGYIMEISEDGYNSIINGTAQFDVSMYQALKILWKISGPLRTVRLSQYDIREGIIETNTRLTTISEPNFLGIIDFVGGDYTKFAIPTS